MEYRKTLTSVGFTLIELLVVMAVLAVLIAGSVLALNPAKRLKQGNDSKIQSDISQVGLALKAYTTDNNYYPSLLSDLVTSGDLKSLPTPPGGTSYVYSRNSACETYPYTNCESALYYALFDPDTLGNVWCWRSEPGQAVETDEASCTP